MKQVCKSSMQNVQEIPLRGPWTHFKMPSKVFALKHGFIGWLHPSPFPGKLLKYTFDAMVPKNSGCYFLLTFTKEAVVIT